MANAINIVELGMPNVADKYLIVVGDLEVCGGRLITEYTSQSSPEHAQFSRRASTIEYALLEAKHLQGLYPSLPCPAKVTYKFENDVLEEASS